MSITIPGRPNHFDIHKLIEAERRSFDEEPYQALRRLLKLPETAREQAKPAGRAWQLEGVTLEHGTKLRRRAAVFSVQHLCCFL